MGMRGVRRWRGATRCERTANEEHKREQRLFPAIMGIDSDVLVAVVVKVPEKAG